MTEDKRDMVVDSSIIREQLQVTGRFGNFENNNRPECSEEAVSALDVAAGKCPGSRLGHARERRRLPVRQAETHDICCFFSRDTLLYHNFHPAGHVTVFFEL